MMNMRPAKHSGKTSFLLITIFFVFNRFHSMTKNFVRPAYSAVTDEVARDSK